MVGLSKNKVNSGVDWPKPDQNLERGITKESCCFSEGGRVLGKWGSLCIDIACRLRSVLGGEGDGWS